MKKFRTFMMFAAIAVASLAVTSCDDDPWDDPWNDHYGWGGNYDQNQTTIYDEADALCGEWEGPVEYTYNNGNGGFDVARFNANMRFSRYHSNSAKGSGVETDYVYHEDGTMESQILTFTWNILNNFDIQIVYDEGGTYILDANASQKGFCIEYDKQARKNVFYGYMLGTGDVAGNQIAFDLEQVNGSRSRATDSGALIKSFGINEFRPTIDVKNGKLVKNR